MQIPWNMDWEFMDTLEAWEVDNAELSVKTLSVYFRYIYLYSLWKLSQKETSIYVVNHTFEQVKVYQRKSHSVTNRARCLLMMDPTRLALLRNKIVRQLKKFQLEKIHPFM